MIKFETSGRRALPSHQGMYPFVSVKPVKALSTEDPVRVMHLVHSFGYGGMEVGVAKLCNALDPSRFQSTICSCRPSDSLKQRLRPEVRLFELNRRPGHDPLIVLQLYRLLRQERPHALHTHGWATLCEGLTAARLARVPVVIHGEHGTLETRRRNAIVQRWAWNRVDRLLAVSSRLSERMESMIGFPASRIQVIRNGVDTLRFTPDHRHQARRRLALPADRIVLGTAGRLVAVKDQATLLRAFAVLRAKGYEFTALIAGTGPLKDDLIALTNTLGLSDVHFLGNRPDVEQVLAAMDVFVLTSTSEGLSNTIQEAMATGLPVVATHVGGADELVVHDQTGFLVPPNQHELLADKLALLFNDPIARTRMGRAGRDRATREFSLERMVADYSRAYIDATGRTAEAYVPLRTRED